MVGIGWLIWPVAKRWEVSWCSQITSFADSDIAMYSAFVIDRVVHSWSFDLHDVALPSSEDIAWCWLSIMRMPGIVGVGVAFYFDQIFWTESRLCIFSSSQITEDVFDGLQMLPSWVQHVPVDDQYDICKDRSNRHHCVHDTSYCRCLVYLSIELSLLIHWRRVSVR